MGRFNRVVALDIPHYVTQRGNARRFILDCDADQTVYLKLLRENFALCSVDLIGYCHQWRSKRCPSSIVPCPEVLSSASIPKNNAALQRVESGHVTPEWELRRNLRFPGGNMCGIGAVQPMTTKTLEFTGSAPTYPGRGGHGGGARVRSL